MQTEKIIKIFDNVFSFDFRRAIYDHILNSQFRIMGWHDAYELEKSEHQYLHCKYNLDDFKTWKFMENLSDEVKDFIDGKFPVSATVNLTVPSDTNFAHTHSGLAILYYANLDWHPEWSGETLFFSEDCQDIVFASPYVPGRIIIFDGTIPHTIRPQTYLGAHYRFTLAVWLGSQTTT